MNNRPTFQSPSELAEALRLLAADPQLEIIAGGTDLWPKWSASRTRPEKLLSLHRLHTLRQIEEEDGLVRIGALCTHAQLRSDELVRRACPSLAAAAATVGAGQIQNRGTIGGNVVNASPAADLPPVLLAAGAKVELTSAHGSRVLPLSDFYLSYRQTARRPDELLTCVLIPALPAEGREFFRKIGTRRAQAISKVVGSMRLVLGRERQIASAGLAFGSVAPIPLRLAEVERWLVGRRLGSETALQAANLAISSVHPINDLRSTAEYRRFIVGRLVASWLQ